MDLKQVDDLCRLYSLINGFRAYSEKRHRVSEVHHLTLRLQVETDENAQLLVAVFRRCLDVSLVRYYRAGNVLHILLNFLDKSKVDFSAQRGYQEGGGGEEEEDEATI